MQSSSTTVPPRACISSSLLLAALSLSACSSDEPKRDDRVPVRTIVVGNAGGQTSVANELPRYAGSIASSFESEVAFRVPGRVATRRANLGEFVQAGAALATLDPSPFAIAARSTDAAVAAARAEVAQAEAEFARNAPLAADRIVAPAQLDRLRAQRDAARASDQRSGW